jgi:hypothetical protein
MIRPLLLIALTLTGSPAFALSTRQAEVIRLTSIAGEAGIYCAQIVAASMTLGDALIATGMQPDDFNSPEYKRIREAAKAEMAAQPVASLCGTLWNMFGPAGNAGPNFVRLRRPSDQPFPAR